MFIYTTTAATANTAVRKHRKAKTAGPEGNPTPCGLRKNIFERKEEILGIS
jgi:hypothetical protein